MTFFVTGKVKSPVKRGLVLLLSPVAALVCFGLLYLLDEAVCGLHFWRWFVWGRVTAVTPFMLLLLLLTGAAMLGNAYVGWSLWRRARQDAEDDIAAKEDRFLGASVLMLSGFFSFLT
ncbi:MAG: hypothetical protein R3204_16510, partial [Oceanospirillum sp.]|nr:hypothetical protein [Oceanospirillum sp.]